MNLSTCTSAGSLPSGLNLGRSLSECLGKGCCIPGTTIVAVLIQGSCGFGGLGGGLPPPPTGTFLAIGLLSELEELPELEGLGLSGGDSGGEGG